jgi:mono/diheme cytochrome c family protein
MNAIRFTRLAVMALVATASLHLTATLGHAEDDAEHKALVRQGARLWSPYCGGCHNARPPGERSPDEWDTIMLHMRVRANLPAQDAKALLEYLKTR